VYVTPNVQIVCLAIVDLHIWLDSQSVGVSRGFLLKVSSQYVRECAWAVLLVVATLPGLYPNGAQSCQRGKANALMYVSLTGSCELLNHDMVCHE
jgi:hypothetical protein